jgi:hypothetical protein
MSTFVTNFNNILPPARFDGNPWTQILVYESATEEGTFALLDTVAISSLPGGVDSNPAEPAYRNVTVSNATVERGYYYFVFKDAIGNQTAPTNTICNAPSVKGSIRPTLIELGSILTVRTAELGSGGVQLGTFTERTRPTAEQAEQVIDQAVNVTLLKIGPDIAPGFWQETKTVVLYLAAQLIELGFYKNEIDKGISGYEYYGALYTQAIDGLVDSINSDTPASPTQSWSSMPVVTRSQANFQYLMKAYDPVTGVLDPSKLPPDMNYPIGIGGLPASFYTAVNSPYYGLDATSTGASFLDEW